MPSPGSPPGEPLAPCFTPVFRGFRPHFIPTHGTVFVNSPLEIQLQRVWGGGEGRVFQSLSSGGEGVAVTLIRLHWPILFSCFTISIPVVLLTTAWKGCGTSCCSAFQTPWKGRLLYLSHILPFRSTLGVNKLHVCSSTTLPPHTALLQTPWLFLAIVLIC